MKKVMLLMLLVVLSTSTLYAGRLSFYSMDVGLDYYTFKGSSASMPEKSAPGFYVNAHGSVLDAFLRGVFGVDSKFRFGDIFGGGIGMNMDSDGKMIFPLSYIGGIQAAYALDSQIDIGFKYYIQGYGFLYNNLNADQGDGEFLPTTVLMGRYGPFYGDLSYAGGETNKTSKITSHVRFLFDNSSQTYLGIKYERVNKTIGVISPEETNRNIIGLQWGICF